VKLCGTYCESRFKADCLITLMLNPKREKRYPDAGNREVAAKLAFESLVLLQNKNNLLPLNRNQTIAVIGPLANDKSSQTRPLGGKWSSRRCINATRRFPPKNGRRSRVVREGG